MGRCESLRARDGPLSIYKTYDILGNDNGELTPDLYRNWGRTLGRQVGPGAKFVIGGDVRESTPGFLAALAEGLTQMGGDVIDLGILPTPMVYYAKRRLRAAGCAVVTASHHPAGTNGLKWMVGNAPPDKNQVRLLREEAEAPGALPAGRTPGSTRSLDVSFDYVAWLQLAWVQARQARLHVVVDAGSGCWSARARRYLQAVFPQCLFSVLHDAPDGRFSARSPDCSRPESIEGLCEAVYRERADLGLAFDGDGDRLALVDNGGTPLTSEEAAWLLLQCLGQGLQGRPFVCDVRFSDRIAQAAEQLGATPVVARPGQAFLHRRMIETGAPFGAEISGHYAFDAVGGTSDALFAACHVIAHLASRERALSDLRSTCPRVYMTPDLRVRVPWQERESVFERVRAAWSDYPQTTVDGVCVRFPDGWALVRNSGTEPALSFRFEASDWERLRELVYQFCNPLGEAGTDLWIEYSAAMEI